MENEQQSEPWIELQAIVEKNDPVGASEFLDQLSPGESSRAVSRLSEEDQVHLLGMLPEEAAANLLGELPPAQASEVFELLEPECAAAIAQMAESAERVDLIQSLSTKEAVAVLDELPQDSAKEVLWLMEYPEDCAGGMMITEIISFQAETTVEELLNHLSSNSTTYARYDVQYLYVVNGDNQLLGVLPFRSTVLSQRHRALKELMIPNPTQVDHMLTRDDLHHFFDRHPLLGIPVVDEEQHLLGVVRRVDVERAVEQQAGKTFLKFAGILGGEELRTMPIAKRTARRLSWLSINVFLNVIAASVIAFHQDTLSQVIALAVFLPIISDMSGCSGSQAVAVSMRELTLGLIKPRELLRVLFKEASVGMVNGVVLGCLLGTVAFLWKGNLALGLVVGVALGLNTLLAVCLGGIIPLILRKLKQDPALASGPVLTTLTDMCGFMLVLSFASIALPWLTAS